MSANPIDESHWGELQELFHLVEETPEAMREQVLAEACADAELRERAMAIFLASQAEVEPRVAAGADRLGKVGPYQLIRLLGSGGIGSVYLAERMMVGTPQRSALKVLAPHAAGPMFVERFEREQRILGSLEHPNITRMLDAGLSGGEQPYLVMEYVNGVHLDVYCDQHRLTVARRLELFLQVCDAVAYAHRNLIVHLDLKPSNILVTESGVVKLLDFGTSKLIEPDSLLTTTVMATPAYASPEQLRNEAVTTACDIYSLGAILFELLSGRRPGGKASVAVMIERAIREREPERLPDAVEDAAAVTRSTTTLRLRSLLKGDLATITARCLRSRAQDRYRSVDALTEDLRRYMAGRPVLASPQTLTYRLRKFVRRNRKVLVASGFAAVLVAASLADLAYRQVEAVRGLRRAVEMQAFMMQLFRLTRTNYLGQPAQTVPEFLELGTRLLPQMITDPGDRRAGQIILAQSMYSDDDYVEAQATLQPVIAEARRAGDLAAVAEAEGLAAQVAFRLSQIKQYMELSADALALADQPGVSAASRVWIKIIYTEPRYELNLTTAQDVAIQRDALREAQGIGVPASELGYAKLVYVLVSGNVSPFAESLRLSQEAVDLFRRQPYSVCELGRAELALGFYQGQARQMAASLATYSDAHRAFVQCRGEDSAEALTAAAGVGGAMVFLGRQKEAIPLLEATLGKMETLPRVSDGSLILALAGLDAGYRADGRFQQAEAASARLLQLIGGRRNSSLVLGLCQFHWAQALAGEGSYAEALKHATVAERAYAEVPVQSPAVAASRREAQQLVAELQAKVR